MTSLACAVGIVCTCAGSWKRRTVVYLNLSRKALPLALADGYVAGRYCLSKGPVGSFLSVQEPHEWPNNERLGTADWREYPLQLPLQWPALFATRSAVLFSLCSGGCRAAAGLHIARHLCDTKVLASILSLQLSLEPLGVGNVDLILINYRFSAQCPCSRPLVFVLFIDFYLVQE